MGAGGAQQKHNAKHGHQCYYRVGDGGVDVSYRMKRVHKAKIRSRYCMNSAPRELSIRTHRMHHERRKKPNHGTWTSLVQREMWPRAHTYSQLWWVYLVLVALWRWCRPHSGSAGQMQGWAEPHQTDPGLRSCSLPDRRSGPALQLRNNAGQGRQVRQIVSLCIHSNHGHRV